MLVAELARAGAAAAAGMTSRSHGMPSLAAVRGTRA